MFIDITNQSEAETVYDELDKVSERAKELQTQIDSLKEKVRLAKGTADVTREAGEAVAPQKLNLMARLEVALREKPMALEELSGAMGESTGKVQSTLKGARTTGKLHNVGAADRPVWFWRIGKEATSTEVQKGILALIRHQPMTFVELKAATRAEDNQIQKALIAIRQSGVMVANMGTQNRARYFVLPEGAIDARLPAKK